MADNTTIGSFPKELVDYFRCKLLHEKRPYWDGTFYYDKNLDKNLPNIKYLCKVCDKDDYDTAKNQEASRTSS